MKGIIVFIFSFLIIEANAQGINFQGVSRSANGTILVNSNISLRLSIMSKSVDATPEFVEIKKVVTNTQGIFSIVIGDAFSNATIGSFKTINWADAPKFLKVEMDPSGGTNFINMGITQLQYVPFSFYSLGVAAENVNGILPIAKGGTGVSSLVNLKSTLALDKVNNTADSSKPVSTPTRIALADKLNSKDTNFLSSRINGKLDYIKPGSVGSVIISDGNKWIAGSLNYQKDVFAAFMVDSTNMRLQNNSLSKLNKNRSSFVGDSAEINKGNYAWYNIAIGDSALYLVDSGSNNIAIGFKSLIKNTSGNSNTSIGGNNNLNANTRGYQNNAVGSATMNANTTGNRNNSFGTLAMNANTTGFANSAFGNAALMNSVTGNENSSFGRMSTLGLKAGSYNSAFGNQALSNDTIGNFNTAIGFQAGAGLRNGSYNVFLGNNAGNNPVYASANNRLVIANSNTSTPLIYGEFDNGRVSVNGVITATGFKLPNGTSAQYLRADGTVSTSVTAGVPYTGASQAVDLGAYDLKVNGLTVGLGSGTSTLTSSTNLVFGNNALASNATGTENIAIGKNALSNNTTGRGNLAFGNTSLIKNTTGNENIAIGDSSLAEVTTNNYSLAIGSKALKNNTTGLYNNAIGNRTMYSNTTGSYNIAFGGRTLANNTTGSQNIAIGNLVLYSNIEGTANVAIGDNALKSNNGVGIFDAGNGITWQNASGNTAVGNNSMRNNTNGSWNTAIGNNAMQSNTTAINNVAVGTGALSSITTNGDNTAVGSYSLKSNTASSNAAFGSHALQTNTSGGANTAIGTQAMEFNTTGQQNTALGLMALNSNITGSSNTAVGYQALKSNNGTGNANGGWQNASGNTSVGYQSLFSNSNGTNNTVLGNQAMYSNTTSINNVAVGGFALKSNTTQDDNTAIGFFALNASNAYGSTAVGSYALSKNTSGQDNTALGSSTLVENITGNNNTALGRFSLNANLGNSNTAVGSRSTLSNTTGASNTAIGINSLVTNTTGSNNTAIGSYADVASNNLSNATAIGNGAVVSASNTIQLGNSSVNEVKTSGVVTSAKGFLPPRLSSSQRDAISSPATGLIVFCSNCGVKGQMQYYDGTAWVNMMGGAAASGLSIGDNYQGGIIAYIFSPSDPGYDPLNIHGIIASSSDQGTGAWGCEGTLVGTIDSLGSGLRNTQLIVAACNQNFIAAKLCYDLVLNGFSDWFLPSLAEMRLLRSNLHLNNRGNFRTNLSYFVSTEATSNTAYEFYISSGAAGGINKQGNNMAVRAIRYF